jgi:predicted amidohydrolase
MNYNRNPAEDSSLHVAALQFAVRTGQIEANLNEIIRLTDSLQLRAINERFDLLLLPEMALTGFDYARLPQHADKVAEALNRLIDILYDIASHIALSIPFRHGNEVSNRLIILSGTGDIIAFYDKIHCIGHGGFRETDFIRPGSEVKTVLLKGWRIGLSICYDLRFPELYRLQRPDLILLPAQWPSTRHEHLLCLARARAIENQACLILCNMTGRAGSMDFCGNSQIIDAKGSVLADAGINAGLIRGVLNHKELTEWRTNFPALHDAKLL